MIRSSINAFVAIVFICFVFLTSILFFPIALFIWFVTIFFDRRLRWLHQFTCFWASLYLWVFPLWTITVHGREKIDKDKTYVIVSNHQSLVDILAAFALFTHFKWVSNPDLFNIPLIGWNMRLNRYIRLERGKNRSIKKMYKSCEKNLKRGNSIFLFPEGMRSAGDEMKPFREGAFVLAKRREVPILPLVISGSSSALPEKGWIPPGRANIDITILDEISPDSFQDITSKNLALRTRDIISRELNNKTSTPAVHKPPHNK
jgi:1-acyl-sn-glycerol-3-phosphate acyltransferase